jgi:hypothetical protein
MSEREELQAGGFGVAMVCIAVVLVNPFVALTRRR